MTFTFAPEYGWQLWLAAIVVAAAGAALAAAWWRLVRAAPRYRRPSLHHAAASAAPAAATTIAASHNCQPYSGAKVKVISSPRGFAPRTPLHLSLIHI